MKYNKNINTMKLKTILTYRIKPWCLLSYGANLYLQ